MLPLCTRTDTALGLIMHASGRHLRGDSSHPEQVASLHGAAEDARADRGGVAKQAGKMEPHVERVDEDVGGAADQEPCDHTVAAALSAQTPLQLVDPAELASMLYVCVWEGVRGIP